MEETRKVAFICSKGNLDMAYPALVMGWAALGNGIDVTIFFTFWGLNVLRKDDVMITRNDLTTRWYSGRTNDEKQAPYSNQANRLYYKVAGS